MGMKGNGAVVNSKVLLTTTFIASTVFAQGPAPAPIAPPSAGGAAPGAADVSVKQRPDADGGGDGQPVA